MGYESHEFVEQDDALAARKKPADRLSVVRASLLDQRHIVPQARGDVVEIGIGAGANLALYKAGQISSLTGVDPKANTDAILTLSEQYEMNVEVLVQSIDAVALDDGVADCVVSTHTLCMVPDPEAALLEVWRLLKPGGKLLFCERGRHHRNEVARMQDLLAPMWSLMAHGCQINRNMFRLIERAGFYIDFLETGTEPFKPSVVGYLYSGIAVKI